MKKIGDLELYVGTKEEYNYAENQNMKIVCALNRVNGYVTHQSLVGWSGRGCPKDHPNYLVYENENIIALNMIDGDNFKYINDDMINPALNFIKRSLNNGEKVFIYCSLGESRSPSIALMFLLESNLLDRDTHCLENFKATYYPSYNPKRGVSDYILNRYCQSNID